MSETAGAVFLSCARDDAAAARRIADALRSTGIEVWFDQNELEGGDAWDTKIRKQIQLCALFVPVISAATQARGEEYFRLEWKLAVDRSHLMADDAPFLFPVVIDDTTDAAARVPDKFRDVQWTRLNVKDTPESLAARVGRLLAKADDDARKKSFRALFSTFRFSVSLIHLSCCGCPSFSPMKSTLSRLLVAALFSAAALAPVSGQTSVPTTVAAPATVAPISAKSLDGHSAHGEAFDSGPRQKPWIMEGIGHAPFPITTKNPEVQTWFNQGNALLHSFAWYDAERAFRWCLKIEPGNAMAYWGLALATESRDPSGPNRAADFLREAVKRKAEVTERERLFIEAWVPILLPDLVTDPADEVGSDRYSGRNGEHIKRLETLCIKFPDDMDARAYLARATMGGGRYGTELIIREILAHQPNHPGAHHYRIHNWDYHEPEQALTSCRAYTAEVPGIGHAQHMPGHIYSIIGMWDEAAISMDAATRLEKRAMQDSFTFTFDNWNYGHNRAYLSYIQEQLGLPEAALAGARQMVDAPLDPERNSDNFFSTHSQGLRAIARVLLKYQRWDELLLPATIPWREGLEDRINKQYVEARARFGQGDRYSGPEEHRGSREAEERGGGRWDAQGHLRHSGLGVESAVGAGAR